ncbi:alpha/beta hydrolase [Streptomyces sp. BB1-1-1]|uniref:alpha/beta hydrolase n=1 Tax=Streptomyces sp. BB1-1-1 TaxID=3074430 RepID=UPI00287742D2|nr:alpha/beta hydrolase [Streptomyces sp. BB1-1-1]WND34127.1 alpha/beta hydrolase [Streptomyces sp. BB1-1-1]
MRKYVVAVLATVMVALLTWQGASAETAPSTSPERVSWGECPDGTSLPGLECGTLEVPLDYRDPEGEKIALAISRMASPQPHKRRGVLLTNAGGPGEPGLNYPLVLKYYGVPQSVLDTYDVIGFDPRGVGRSAPVTCDLEGEATATANIPEYALDSADVAERAEYAAEVAEKCGSAATAPMLPHISTANTARDMDRIRAALGEPKISYLGISYGTYLGSVYTTLFPRRSAQIVLDSAMGPKGSGPSASRGFGEGVEDRFPDFAKYLSEHPEYGFGTSVEGIRAKYFEIAARLDAEPRPDGFDGKRFRKVTFEKLYLDQWLPELAEIWRAVETGQPLPQTSPSEVPARQPADNAVAGQLAVLCNDRDWPESVATYQRNVEADRSRYPMFGAAAANIWPCAFWPTEPSEPPVRINSRGPSNVLIVQNLRDPSTPLSGARELRRAFGERARMITADQGGHLAYLFLKNRCLNDRTTNFLVTGELPRTDVACAAEPNPN